MGYDAGKRTKGRKRHLLTDTLGLPLRVVVHSAGIQDRDGAALVLDGLRSRCPHLELVWADAGYREGVGRPGLPTRLMVGLHLIKHMDGL